MWILPTASICLAVIKWGVMQICVICYLWNCWFPYIQRYVNIFYLFVPQEHKMHFFHSRSTTIQTPNLLFSYVVRLFLMLICKFFYVVGTFAYSFRIFVYTFSPKVLLDSFSKVFFIYRKQLYPQLLISISTYIKSINLNYRF